MRYNSKKDICKEFNIDSTLEIDEIIKELTKMQAGIHPDINPNFTDEEKETFTNIEEAKSFLRNIKSDSQIIIADLVNALQKLEGKDIYPVATNRSLQNEVKQSADNIIKKFKKQYLPRKITTTSILAVISLIWAFPNAMLEHPILGHFLDIDTYYLSLSVLWILSLYAAVAAFTFAYSIESKVQRIMTQVQNLDYQYEIFMSFIRFLRHKDDKVTEFSFEELKEYLDFSILPHTTCVKSYKKIPKQLHVHILEITPQISNMIIAHALKKGIITQKNELGWYDKYFINI